MPEAKSSRHPLPRLATLPPATVAATKTCVYCFTPLGNSGTVDHFFPKKHRRKHSIPTPKYPCCTFCNTMKGGMVFTTVDGVRGFILRECLRISKNIIEASAVQAERRQDESA